MGKRIIRSGVYQIINEMNGKSYVGSSKDINNRWSNWKRYFKKPMKHTSLLWLAVKKYGIEHFTFIILEECESSKETLESREQYYIDTLKPEYNLMKVARNGFQHAPETIERMKATLLSGQNGARKAMEKGTFVSIQQSSTPESRQRAIETNIQNGFYDRILPVMTESALSEESKIKRKISYEKIKHQQGENNSQYGTCWITDGKNNKKIRKQDIDLYAGFTKGRS